jgi:hypothetical protein
MGTPLCGTFLGESSQARSIQPLLSNTFHANPSFRGSVPTAQ